MLSHSVLLVEDDAMLGPLYVELLSQAGFAVEHVSNAHDALEYLAHRNVDLALLDIMLPEVSGVELLHDCRQMCMSMGKPLPIFIMLSNLHQLALQEQLISQGAAAFLVKSDHTPDQFLHAIHAHLPSNVLP